MESEPILISGIRCAARLRAVSPERVTGLAESLRSIGLQTPISVRIVPEFRDEDGSITTDVPILVAGRHRLEAAKSLGWPTIDAFVMDGDERDFRLWEIAENLHRAELTVQERAEHIAEWVRLTGEKLPQLGEISGGRGHKGGVSEAARVLPIEGKTEKARQHNVERAVKIAGLSDEAKKAARETGRDNNQAVLLKAAAAPKEEQATIIREYTPAPRVKPAPAPLNDLETEEQWMSAIMRVWNRGAQQWRERFLEAVDRPIFDDTRAA